MLPTVASSLIIEACSALRAGVGSRESGLLLARRPLRRGGGSIAAWRDVALFFLLGGGELVSAAMTNATGESEARFCLEKSRPGPCSACNKRLMNVTGDSDARARFCKGTSRGRAVFR